MKEMKEKRNTEKSFNPNPDITRHTLLVNRFNWHTPCHYAYAGDFDTAENWAKVMGKDPERFIDEFNHGFYESDFKIKKSEGV